MSMEPAEGSESVTLIDENQWAIQIREEECVQQSQLKLQNRVEAFLQLATLSEQKELNDARDQLWTLMKEAKSKDDERNPTVADGAKKTASQKFKEGYSAFLNSGYELSKHVDLFVTQAPEYVSLVWGAIKILMVVQISNEELKLSVHTHLKILARNFDLVDHLPDLMPQKNLVTALAEAYSLFSRFLAKAIKYYSECRTVRYLKAFTRPWKVRFQVIVDEMDDMFRYIHQLASAQGHIAIHRSLVVGEMNLFLSKRIAETNEKMLNIVQIIPQQLRDLEDRLQAISFENAADLSQTSGGLQQRLEERFSEPAKLQPEANPSLLEMPGTLEEDIFDIFTDLREFDQVQRQANEQVTWASESREQRAKRRNLLQSDKIIAWIESEESELLWVDGNHILDQTGFLTSFATPIAIDAACNYESILILKFFTRARSTYAILLQALIAQVLKQHPHLLGSGHSSASRQTLKEAGRDITRLWDLFRGLLVDSGTGRVYIIIDGVDALESSSSGDYDSLMSRLNGLVNTAQPLVKILLTARVLAKSPLASDISNALSVRETTWAEAPLNENLPTMQQTFVEIQEGRCKLIAFPQLMLLYAPKTVIFTKQNGEYQAFIVSDLSGMREIMPGRFDPLHLRVWSIDHNGHYFTKRYRNLTIGQFSGRKPITSLRYIPTGYLPDEAIVRSDLVQRGRRYWQFGTKPQRFSVKTDIIEGVVMVDLSMSPNQDIPAQEYEDQLPTNQHAELKSLTLILCPAVVPVFSLDKVKWVSVKINSLTLPPQPKNVTSVFKLALEEESELLLASVNMHVDRRRTGDIHGPGSGLVMLFHGPYGVGKTPAIQILADAFGLPLLVIDVSRFNGAMEVEARLQEYLDLGSRWNAIVLIRDAEQLICNPSDQPSVDHVNVQNVLIREIDEYEGILILTTNTINLDRLAPEFLTIIRLIFRFHPSSSLQRWKIWTSCLDQLEPSLVQERDDINDWIEDNREVFDSLALNERDIQNIIQVALSLSHSSSQKLRVGYVRQAVKIFRQQKGHKPGSVIT